MKFYGPGTYRTCQSGFPCRRPHHFSPIISILVEQPGISRHTTAEVYRQCHIRNSSSFLEPSKGGEYHILMTQNG